MLDTRQPAHSSLTSAKPRGQFMAPADTTQGFTVRLRTDLRPPSGKVWLLEIPGVLGVCLRQHDPADRERQNYPAFSMPDGSVPVFEATLSLHSREHPEWREMTIGFPLAMLGQPTGEHDVVLSFSGVCWAVAVDGTVLDNDFPFGSPRWAETNPWRLAAEAVSEAALYVPAITPTTSVTERRPFEAIQYWTPAGHNAWVGDVATFYHQGRYHVFYLYDRRHHRSKFGMGAHYFEHLSSADLRTWTEHDAATPLEAPWECIGTGTPFAVAGQLCLAYGLHTERIYADDKTTLPAQMAYLRTEGCTGTFDRSAPGVPIGATYSVCQDGIADFRKTWRFFHPCRNPSVYWHPDGTLRMLANNHGRGTWESACVDGGWRCLSPDFPPGGDCTFFFRWGRYDYIIGGFRDLWSKPADAPDSAYENLAHRGLDFYDGLNVPAVSEISGGRFLMAGWTHVRGWGGNLVLRELVQFPDGRVGCKWPVEVVPGTAEPRTLAAAISGTAAYGVAPTSFLLTFTVTPRASGSQRAAVLFRPASGAKAACELLLDLENRRAQFSPGSPDGFGARQRSLREGGAPHEGGDYAVENLIGVDEPFLVRVVVKTNAKLGGSLVDAEVAGVRTMISYRPDLTVGELVFRTAGVELSALRVAPLRGGT